MKRLNPSTGRPFIKGDKREDGYIFNQYFNNKLRQNGTFEESWLSPKTYFRERVRVCMKHAQSRAKAQGVCFDIDVDYLLSIFPSDGRCPVTGVELSFGGQRDNSPSLDRFHPDKGYTRGNLCWISNKANLIKQDIIDPAVFRAIARYVESPEEFLKEHYG